MANHKSALKRVRQNRKRYQQNKARKTRIKNLIKDLDAAIASKSVDEVKIRFIAAQKYIDKIGKSTGVMHRRTASRKISRLAARVNKFMKTASA